MIRVMKWKIAALMMCITMVFGFVFTLDPIQAGAETSDSYEQLSQQFPDYIDKLIDKGADESQIRSLVQDLEQALQGQQLTEENFNDAVMEAALQLVSQDKHKDVVDAILAAYPQDVQDLMQGKISAGLMPVYNVLKQNLLSENNNASDSENNNASDSESNNTSDSENNNASDSESNNTSDSENNNASDSESNNTSGSESNNASDSANDGTPGAETSEPVVTTPVFSDIAGHWAREYVERMAGMKAVRGYTDGTFKPDNYITRAEFATILARAEGWPAEESALKFTDAAAIPDWAKESVSAVVYSGVITGYEDNTFQAGRLISRAEIAVMLTRALGKEASEQPLAFVDAASIPSSAAGYVSTVVNEGIMKGLPGNLFKPAQYVTRAEAAAMAVHLLSGAAK
ncbi:hypothetical protein DCCM_3018 [Desulfocucumis palustris]|uniref:SLH domain-containing protein n=1 Tax=Desulfocucumis palustris TaxID=1898651 RepID=A0A2L2XC47_9FIRM|nr:S-layer homology domain-containing protein [Desulfocucumis palustris]GBF33907.1 hypothetical protein DCCM_3018 [Desulfocucumis palustris]